MMMGAINENIEEQSKKFIWIYSNEMQKSQSEIKSIKREKMDYRIEETINHLRNLGRIKRDVKIKWIYKRERKEN